MKPLLAACLSLLAGCSAVQRPGGRPPLEREGEAYLYLDAFPRGSERLAFAVGSIQAVAADGRAVPLDLALADLSGASVRSQRLLASGRLEPGSYAGLLVKVERATLRQDEGASDLVVPAEPVRIDAPFTVAPRRATVLWARLDAAASVRNRVEFAPALAVSSPDPLLPELSGYCSNSGDDNLTVFDRRTHRVTGVVPVGRQPAGLALDPARRRAYVALSGEDAVAIVDLHSSEEVGRVLLRPGDGPREVALAPDGRSLLVANGDSATVSFVDADAEIETDRLPVGVDPVSLLLDRSGQRAYVFHRASASITVIDVPNRSIVRSVATEPEPIRGRLNRDGSRLYVLQAGSPYLAVLSAPDLTPISRVLVGVGAGALELDARTDLVYVGDRFGGALRVFDPASLLPVARVEVPGPVTRGEIDGAEDVLFTVVPSRRMVAANELVSGRALAPVEVGNDPYQVAVYGARR